METDRSRDPLHEQLHEIERGETASWVVYPPTPWWWPPAFGVWAAGFTLVVGALDGFVEAVANLGLIAMMGLAMVWDRRRRGTYPTGLPPRELHGAVARFVTGAIAVAAVTWLVCAQVGLGWAAAVAAVAAVGSWALVARYEHEYAVIAARVRERLR